jgi:hypothetical protein
MRTARHRHRPAALLAAAALVLAGCGTDDDPDAAAAAGASDAGDDAGDDDPETNGEGAGDEGGSGEATWMGEELAIERVSCSAGRPEADIYQVRASGDGFDLTAQMLMDVGASDGDDAVLASDEVDVDLFFQGEGGTIGDGEGYSSGRSDDDGSGLEGDVGQVSGTVGLGPDMSSRASEVNPDGGVLELDLRC